MSEWVKARTWWKDRGCSIILSIGIVVGLYDEDDVMRMVGKMMMVMMIFYDEDDILFLGAHNFLCHSEFRGHIVV